MAENKKSQKKSFQSHLYEFNREAVRGSAKRERKYPRGTWAVLIGIVLSICLFTLLYINFIVQYNTSIDSDSKQQLAEITNQINSYIRESVMNKWRIADEVATDLQTCENEDHVGIRGVLTRVERDWGVGDVCIYTEAGDGYNSRGEKLNVGKVAELMRAVIKQDYNVSLYASDVTFTKRVNLPLEVNGSKVVAVSINEDVSTMIDNLTIASFNGSAQLYLVNRDGSVITRYLMNNEPSAYNVTLLLNDVGSLPKPYKSVKDVLLNAYEATLTYNNSLGQDSYAAISTVPVTGAEWLLVYTVPSNVLNAAAQRFSTTVIIISVLTVIALCALATVFFTSNLKSNREKMERALSMRERLFDLLASETEYAFALLDRRKEQPLYVTANTTEMLGGFTLCSVADSHPLQLARSTGETSESLARLNSELMEWNETSDFASSYIQHVTETADNWFVVKIYPVAGDEDEFIVITQEVTKERERDMALRSALATADIANRAKTQFLSNMSHDIRTPMNAIINMSDFAMQSRRDPVRLTEYLMTIQNSSKHLLSLINDILDMSRIESGKITVELERVALATIIKEIAEIIHPLAGMKGQRFRHAIDIENMHVRCDKLKLSQILINLLNNAVKFTPEGGKIDFRVTELPSLKEEYAAFRFSVGDTGIGIPREYLSTLFEPFNRVNTSVVSRTEGSGLGLSIAKGYVDAMGGSIYVESVLGGGSEFTVELSFEKDLAVEQLPIIAPEIDLDIDFAGIRALICEDDAINRKIAQLMLKKLGMKVEFAVNGGEAVDFFLKSSPGYYDMVFMDIQMPVMDGYDATRKIRQSKRADAQTVPIIAMTANVFAEDIERARAAGMNAHIGKPIDRKLLISTIQKIIHGGN